MQRFLKVTLASIIGFGTIGVVTNLMTKEAKAVEIITHWVPHEVYGQIGEPDNNGKVFFSGLGAKY
ncbi:MAG: hydrazine oxidoreductase HzoA, partial [Candidatus Brocadia sp.]|nr:hydrazine oxidoreductase HzoA [Candidatus Brocadia sp.]MDG5998186.1 hydrazine oxidoreductase HzoA [Candidatus Brocadia sp.]